MIHPSSPRIPAVDKNGRLLWNWREELSRRRNPRGTLFVTVAFLVFLGFFLLVREVLPPSTFEPHFDISGTLGVWIILSVAFTILTFVLMSRTLKMFQRVV